MYDRHRYEAEKRAALEAWERRLFAILEGEGQAEVVPIARHRGR